MISFAIWLSITTLWYYVLLADPSSLPLYVTLVYSFYRMAFHAIKEKMATARPRISPPSPPRLNIVPRMVSRSKVLELVDAMGDPFASTSTHKKDDPDSSMEIIEDVTNLNSVNRQKKTASKR
jgi:hypothetical protein